MLNKSAFHFNENESLDSLILSVESAEMELGGCLDTISHRQRELNENRVRLTSLENLYRQLEISESLSTESIGLMVGQLPPLSEEDMATLESLYVDNKELSLEAISNLWDRYKQLYVSSWHALIDDLETVLGGVARNQKEHRKLHSKLSSEWKSKKRDITSSEHNISLVGVKQSYVFYKEDRLIRDPLKELSEDVEYSEYMLVEYPKLMTEYADELVRILKSGKYESDGDFEKSVLQPVVNLGHPRNVFNLKIVGRPSSLVGNGYLIESKSKSKSAAGRDKVYEDLSEMIDGLHVKRKLINWRDLFRNPFELIHDVTITPDDLDEFLSIYDRYIECLVGAQGRIFTSMKNMKKFSKTKIDTSKAAELSDENSQALIQVGKLVKSMDTYLNKPTNSEIGRVKEIMTSLRTVISRAIATFK